MNLMAPVCRPSTWKQRWKDQKSRDVSLEDDHSLFKVSLDSARNRAVEIIR